MIEVSYASLRSDNLKKSFEKIMNCKLDAKVSYNILRIAQCVEKKVRDSQREWIELGNKYIESEGGRFLLNEEQNNFKWKEGVDPEFATKEIKDFFAKNAIIDRARIDLTNVNGLNLTATEMADLEPFFYLN